MSDEQKKYLRKITLKKRFILFMQLLIVVGTILLWEYLVKKEIINSFVFSSPSQILETIINLAKTNELWGHILITMEEVIIAFSLGILLGFGVAIILYELPTLAKVLDPFLTMINSLPKVALGPLIIIIAGANMKSIIIMALLINLIISIITIYNGFINVDATKVKLIKTFSNKRSILLTKLVIPNSYNTIVSSLKLNISMSLIGVIMGEFLVSQKGIGYLIIYGTQVFNLSLVMSGIFILLVMSFLLYKIISFIEKKLLRT